MFNVNSNRSCGVGAARGGLICLLATALVVVGISAGQAAVILDDTFADGSRAETNLPTESAVYAGLPSGASISVAPGALSLVLPGSSTKMWTHYADHEDPVALDVGEKLRAMVSFIPRGALYENGSRSFRLGLFYDPTNPHVVTDVNDDGGGTGDPWQDSTGYTVNIPLTTFADPGTLPFDIGKRITNNTSLIGSGGAFNFGASGGVGTAIAYSLGTEYTLTFEVSRDSTSQSTISASFADSSGVLSAGSVTDLGSVFDTVANPDAGGSNLPDRNTLYSTFSHLMFRSSNNTQVADQLDFTRIKVEIIPEPSSVLLGLVSLVGTLLVSRRRVY